MVHVDAVEAFGTNDEAWTFGTGSFVSSADTEVTAFHVVNRGLVDWIGAAFRDVEYQVRREHRDWDVAVLEPVDGSWRFSSPVAIAHSPVIGAAVVRTGYSSTLESRDALMSTGIVSGNDTVCYGEKQDYCVPALVIDDPTGSADSGGPVFNSFGQLIEAVLGGSRNGLFTHVVDLTESSQIYRDVGRRALE